MMFHKCMKAIVYSRYLTTYNFTNDKLRGKLVQHQLKLWQHNSSLFGIKCAKMWGKFGAAPTRVVAAPVELCMPTHSRELAQVTSRDVPSRELAPNIDTLV